MLSLNECKELALACFPVCMQGNEKFRPAVDLIGYSMERNYEQLRIFKFAYNPWVVESALLPRMADTLSFDYPIGYSYDNLRTLLKYLMKIRKRRGTLWSIKTLLRLLNKSEEDIFYYTVKKYGTIEIVRYDELGVMLIRYDDVENYTEEDFEFINKSLEMVRPAGYTYIMETTDNGGFRNRRDKGAKGTELRSVVTVPIKYEATSSELFRIVSRDLFSIFEDMLIDASVVIMSSDNYLGVSPYWIQQYPFTFSSSRNRRVYSRGGQNVSEEDSWELPTNEANKGESTNIGKTGKGPIIKLTDMKYKMSDLYPDDYKFMEEVFNFIDVTDLTLGISMFEECYYLKKIPEDFSASNLLNVSRMFRYCTSLEEATVDLANTIICGKLNSYMDTQECGLFEGCIKLNKVKLTNTNNIECMDKMFSMCKSLNNISYFNTSKVRSFWRMFEGCTSLPSEFPFAIDCSSVVSNDSFMFMFAASSVHKVELKNLKAELQENVHYYIFNGNDGTNNEIVFS